MGNKNSSISEIHEANQDVFVYNEDSVIPTDVTYVIVHPSVSRIPDWAFGCCSNLESVHLPSTITHIGEGSFINCTSLESIKIPPSVKSISKWAFEGCTSLGEVVVPHSVKILGDAFSGCHNAVIMLS
jgi:hypothetical protein